VRRTLIAAVFAILLMPLAASADIDIDVVTPRRARPGDPVRVTARGFLGPRPWPAMEVAMIPMAKAPKPQHWGVAMRRARLRRPPFRIVGTIRRWRPLPPRPYQYGHGEGSIVFRTPDVRSGRYLFGLFCDPCLRGPRGNLIIDRRLVLKVR
jgi:hypothetical protein